MVPLAVPSCREVQRPTLTAPPCALPAAMFDSTFSSKCTLSMPCLILDPDLARTSSIWVKLCRQGTCYGIAAVMMLFLVWGALVLLLESRTSAAQILFSVLLPWSFILATALFLGQQGIVRQVKSRPTHTCVRLVLRGTFVRCPWRSMRRNPVHLSAVFASAVPASTCAKNLPTAQFWQHLVSHATHESAFLPFPAETLFPSASKRSGEAQVLCKIRRDRARSMLHQT